MACAAILPAAMAQRVPAFEIKKIEPVFIDSPQITVGNYRKTPPNRPPQWLEIDVTLDHNQVDKSGPKFADSVTVNFYILLNNADVSPDRKKTLLTGSVTHEDIPFGRGLHTVAFVSPQALLRFFDGKAPTNPAQAITDIGVTVSDAGGVVARMATKSQVRGDKGWWDDTSAFTEVAGRVIGKDQTPFAHLAWDYHLPPKPKAGL